jgi:malonate transporter
MVGVLIGFAIIGFVIAVGYVVGRAGLLGAHADYVLSRLAFFVLSPALLFTVLAEADLESLFSNLLPVAAIAAGVNLVVYASLALAVWRRPIADATIGSLASAYANANNIGLPVSVFVLGDASTSAPVILLQLIVFAPIGLTILDLATSGRPSVRRIVLQPVRNPLIIASALGVVIAVSQVEIPPEVFRPFEIIGGAAIPVVLLTFGMSLHGSRVLAPGTDRVGVVVATALKVVLMPLTAWIVARFVFGLEGHALFAAVTLAALPTGQNVFNYAQRYDRGVVLARDVVLITTALSFPVLLVVAALLAPT